MYTHGSADSLLMISNRLFILFKWLMSTVPWTSPFRIYFTLFVLEVLGEGKYINISPQQSSFPFFRRYVLNHRSNIQPLSGAEVTRTLITPSGIMSQAY